MPPANRRKVFISYCHEDKDLARDRLLACLEAGGVEAIIDIKHFKGGTTLAGQMDQHQDDADQQVLLISKRYLGQPNCQREMARAIAMDPNFTHGLAGNGPKVLPVLLGDVERAELPAGLTRPNPLMPDLRDKRPCAEGETEWDRLVKLCGADLGTSPTAWLKARDKIRRLMRNDNPVCLYVNDNRSVNWRGLIDNVCSEHDPWDALPDLDHRFELKAPCPTDKIIGDIAGARDVLAFNQHLEQRQTRPCRVCFTHFHLAAQHPGWDAGFLSNLTNLVKKQHIWLLAQTRRPMDATERELVPPNAYDYESSLAALCAEVRL